MPAGGVKLRRAATPARAAIRRAPRAKPDTHSLHELRLLLDDRTMHRGERPQPRVRGAGVAEVREPLSAKAAPGADEVLTELREHRRIHQLAEATLQRRTAWRAAVIGMFVILSASVHNQARRNRADLPQAVGGDVLAGRHFRVLAGQRHVGQASPALSRSDVARDHCIGNIIGTRGWQRTQQLGHGLVGALIVQAEQAGRSAELRVLDMGEHVRDHGARGNAARDEGRERDLLGPSKAETALGDSD